MHSSTFVLAAILALALVVVEGQRGPFGFVPNFLRPRNNRPRNNGGFRNNGPAARPAGGVGGCPAPGPNQIHKDGPGGSSYVLSWELNCRSFGARQAASYCRSIGMRPVSLESPQKVSFYNGKVSQARERYFWTGGVFDRSHTVVNWPKGSQNVNAIRNWSRTGGSQRPQPDNREGNEDCVAVLNNFYNDGVVLHDVACHHTKPIICEG